MPTPRMRWSTRSPAGTRNQRGGRRRKKKTGTATPGVRTAVQMVTISAKTGWPGPMSPANQNTISTPAPISIPIQYTQAKTRSRPRGGRVKHLHAATSLSERSQRSHGAAFA